MMIEPRKFLLLATVLSVFFLASCGVAGEYLRGGEQEPEPTQQTAGQGEPRDLHERLKTLPEFPREMRAVWIASVANIDWPSEPGLPSGEQKSELRMLFDQAAMLNMNTIILQVRPAADALYESDMEPWSEYLTGEMGRSPDPEYDPLQFAVEEAHRRGLELHAWINPFRALHPSAETEVTEDHVSRRHPDYVVEYAGQLWMDPGLEEVRRYNIEVALDILNRYDVDGIHLDDYFYPYPRQDGEGNEIDFPDTASWQQHVETLEDDEQADRAEWRRRNVNRYVEGLYEAIREHDASAKFGISPFGIWRPGHPEQIRGMDAYESIYTDSRKWLMEGWLDYYTPQLYWPIDQHPQSYSALLSWWNEQNVKNRHLWPGNFTSRVGLTPANLWPASEIIDQIRITRNAPASTGNIHFSMQALTHEYNHMADSLVQEVYSDPALIPVSPWLESGVPLKPEARLDQLAGRTILGIRSMDEHAWFWAVRVKADGEWHFKTLPGWRQRHELDREWDFTEIELIVVNAVSRTGMKSPNAVIIPENRRQADEM